MSQWPGRLARAGTGLLVLGAAGAVGVASWLAPVPEDLAVLAARVRVPAGPTTLVCPGPVVLPESEDESDPEFNPAPVASEDFVRLVAGAGAERAAVPDPEEAQEPAGPLHGALLEAWPLEGLDGSPGLVADAGAVLAEAGAVGDAVVVTSSPLEGALVGRARPVEGASPRVAAASVSTVAAGDLRGTTAAACQRPGSEFWLVGGGTQLGTTSLLVVHNPGATPSEIGLELWGPAGPVELGRGARYVVPSGGELTLRLSALAAELAGTVVRVTSAGGQIAAYLQVSELDGFTPGGVDLVVPGVEPARRQVLSSVVVAESELDGPGAGLLRLLAPEVAAGSADPELSPEPAAGAPGEVPVRVSFYGEDGTVSLPGTEELVLVPGEVTDLDLGGLTPGAYAVVVESEVPVLAGARVERVGRAASPGESAPVEQAWIASSAPSQADLVAVPGALRADAVISGIPGGEASVENSAGRVAGLLTAFDSAGSAIVTEDVSVPVGSTLRVPLPEGTAAVELVPVTAQGEGSTAPASLSWGVFAFAAGPDGAFVSVLTPPVHGAALGEVLVRHAQRLPLD